MQDYDLFYVSAFPSIATKINDQWSIAGSLAITYTSYEQNKAVVNVDDPANDGKLNIDTDGFHSRLRAVGAVRGTAIARAMDSRIARSSTPNSTAMRTSRT